MQSDPLCLKTSFCASEREQEEKLHFEEKERKQEQNF